MHEYCSCTNTKCPLHPTQHDKGCTPCIEKNLRLKEVPNCFFHLVTDKENPVEDSSLRAFADAIYKSNKDGQ